MIRFTNDVGGRLRMKQPHTTLAQPSSLLTYPAFGDIVAAQINVKLAERIFSDRRFTKRVFGTEDFNGAKAAPSLPPAEFQRTREKVVELGALNRISSNKKCGNFRIFGSLAWCDGDQRTNHDRTLSTLSARSIQYKH